jgi:hypothetical protein
VAKGTAETLPTRRKKALDYLYGLKVNDERICSALNIKAVEDIDLEKLAILRGMCTLVKNGESTIDEVFPAAEPPKSKSDKAADATAAAIKKQQNGKEGKADADPGKVEPK